MPERMRALYAAEVTMTDRWLGVFLDRLHDLRLERDTIVLLVADHGVFLGDHGWSGKISSRLYDELIHVPLVVVDPERRQAEQEALVLRLHPRRRPDDPVAWPASRAPERMTA